MCVCACVCTHVLACLVLLFFLKAYCKKSVLMSVQGHTKQCFINKCVFCIFTVKHGSKLKEGFVFQTLTFVMGKKTRCFSCKRPRICYMY